jgi:hypothetical protein
MVLATTDPEAAQPRIAKIQDKKQRRCVMLNTLY